MSRGVLTSALGVLVVMLATLVGLTPAQAAGTTVVSLTFDDGQASQYPVLAMLQSRGMKGTFYINSAMVGSSGYYMTWPQIHEVYDAGNEIGGHTLHHTNLTGVNTTTATTEVCDDRQSLIAQNLRPVTSFAYPDGGVNATAEAIVQSCGYSSGRDVGDLFASSCRCPYAETTPPRDAYRLRTAAGATSGTTLAELQASVLNAENNGGGWVPFVFHGICDNSCTGDNTVTVGTFGSFLDWLRARSGTGTVVRTVGDVISNGTAAPPSVPTTTVSCSGGACSTWYRTSPVTVTLTAGGVGTSGIGATRYTTDGTDPTTSATATTYSGPFSVAATATVRAFSTNGAGEAGPTVSQAVQIDTVAPTTPYKCGTAGDACTSTTAYPSPVLVTLAASDAGGSGLAKTVYTVDGSDPRTSPTATTYTQPFSLTSTATVKAFSTDVAGNTEPTNSQLITVTPGSGTPGTLTLAPTDDSYTSQGNPTGTHPSDKSININGGTSERRTFLKFTVTALPAGATNITASLRMYSQSDAPSTVVVTASKTGTSWNEATLAWNNQPATGATLSTKAALTSGVYNTFDATGLVTGNGTYSVVLTDVDTTQRFFNSKEATANRPQLVVNYVGP